MKWICVYLLFLNTILYAQKSENADRFTYFIGPNYPTVVNSNYGEALSLAKKLIIEAGKDDNIAYQASENYKLGKLYFDLKNYNEASNALSKSIVLYSKLGQNMKQAAAYYTLGLCFMAKENFERAAIYFSNSKSILTFLNAKNALPIINIQQGLIYATTNKIDLAFPIFKTIVALPDDITVLDAKVEAFYQIGLIEEKNNRLLLASNYFKKSLQINGFSENFEQRSKLLLALSTISEKMFDKKTAYSYLKQYININESISIRNNLRLGTDDYTKFQEAESLKEVIKTTQAIKEQEKTAKFSKLISVFAIAIISILSLLSLSLYKNNKIRTQSNLLLQEKNNELEIAKNKAEKASQARAEFLSTVSHELRTPLNAINGIAHLLLEENPRKAQMDYLSSLKFSGDYLTRFINEILEINKIESHSTQIEEINFDLKLLLSGIQNSLKELALTNKNNLIFEIDHAIPDYLIGDPTKLSQIILNLINNALKFSKNGEVKVIVKQTNSTDIETNLHFAISDTGIGIPEDKLESVFESFSQGSIEVNRKYGGTGLGLTIVKKLIKILGGQISVKSVVDQGSTFSFDLAFQISEQIIPVIKMPKIDYYSKLKNKKILLVEDNKINQMITRKMLHNKNIICEIIDNGEDAIHLARHNKFDLILMDVHLPGINGTVAAEMIRDFDKITPIIALTAISLHENREMLLSFGMNEVITKPFIPEEFYTIIAEHI
jgi:signal transduction histidine kinase/CheY-like chemotaxis protein